MDVREKLVELLDNFHRDLSPFAGNEKLFVVDDNVEQAEYLIEHGVTVQEWVSVDDRLPDKPMKCLVYTKRGDCCGYDILYYNQGFYSQYDNVTHWMPLPEPPEVGLND